ncbi:MAG: hydantoinase/oxoprolinase N-terminal domain-containing protein [Bdellovibrionales bacterium]
MSKSIGVYIGQSFIECSAFDGKLLTESKRYFSAQISEDNAIKSFIESLTWKQIDKIIISSRWPSKIIEKKLSTKVALLVTEGFQNWPSIRQPIDNKRYRRNPKREKNLVERDYIFGISERCNSNGEIEVKPDLEELEFLHKKLQMMEIQTIAIGFLYSNLNPNNEVFIKKFFEKLGYKIICSHEESKYENEVARWWRTVVNAFVSDVYPEEFLLLKSKLHTLAKKIEIVDHQGKLIDETSKNLFASNFSYQHLITDKKGISPHIFYFGLEEFTYLNGEKITPLIDSEYGPIAIKKPATEALCIQPTQVLEPDHWSIYRYSNKEVNYEPGPMLFGKSLNPTFIDILFADSQLDSFESIRDFLRPNSKSRILEILYTFTKDTIFEKNVDGFIDFILKNSFNRIALNIKNKIPSNEKILISGPLAGIFYDRLKNHFPSSLLALDEDHNFLISKLIVKRYFL